MAGEEIICQACGVEAPVKYVEFYQNIGMLFARQHKSIKGNLCKRCIHVQFWKRTGITLAVGWLGTISFIIAPIFVLMNTVRYICAIGLGKTPPDAAPPVLTERVARAIQPHYRALVQRVNGGQPLNDAARETAAKAGVTPGQVLLYVRYVAQQSAPAPKTYGFPVMPASTRAPIPVQPISEEPMVE